MKSVKLTTSYQELDQTPALEGFNGVIVNFSASDITITPSEDGSTAGTTVTAGKAAITNISSLPKYIKASAECFLLCDL